MVKTLKKQWFVVLIAVIFIGFAVFCVYDTNKGKLPGKSVDGKDLVATLGDKTNFTADDLYKNMYDTSGKSLLYLKFQSSLIDETVETTDAIEKQAKTYKESLTSYMESQASSNGSNPEDLLKTELAQYGFAADEVDFYCRVIAKMDKVRDDYIKKNLDDLFTPIYNAKKSRTVGHILIKVADVNNPTAEEKKKIKAVEDALEKGTSFEDVAKKYSEDTGSQSANGYIGYLDSESGFVDSFKNKAVTMRKGQISEWVKESNDNYSGWHMIKVYETEKAAIEKDTKAKDTLYSAISTQTTDLAQKYMSELVKKTEIKFANDSIKKEIYDTLGIKE